MIKLTTGKVGTSDFDAAEIGTMKVHASSD
jgi:hypothetical protein